MYKSICYKLMPNFAEDLFQEMCILILELPENKVPTKNIFQGWYFLTARNMSSKTGQFGKKVLDRPKYVDVFDVEEGRKEKLIREAERFMLDLNEFETRVILLYNELGDMKKVQKATGISYSALRKVKDKISNFRNNI